MPNKLRECRFCGSNSVEPFLRCVVAAEDKHLLLDPKTPSVRCPDCGAEASLAVWQSPPLPFNEGSEREAFEIAAVQQLKVWRDRGNVNNDNGSPATRESLCWRTDDGNYGVLLLNAAWFGWATRAKR